MLAIGNGSSLKGELPLLGLPTLQGWTLLSSTATASWSGTLSSATFYDEQELPRTRMALCKIRVALKNRVHATLAKYNLSLPTESDIFASKWSSQLNQVIEQLPVETQNCPQREMQLLEGVQDQLRAMEERISLTPDMQLLKTVPGVGDILAIVVGTEIGLIERFASAEQLASYAGTVPAVKSSGGKTRAILPRSPTIISNGLLWKQPMALLSTVCIFAGSTGMSRACTSA